MGFLNPAEDDDYRISQMAGTTEVPAPGAFQGLLTAVPKGLTGAGLKVGSLATDAADTLGLGETYRQFRSLNDQSAEAFGKLGVSFGAVPIFDKDVRDKAEAAKQVAAGWAATGQDPRQTGVVGRIAAGTTEGVSIGAAGAYAGGPWGAAALLGSTYGHSTYLEAKQNGVDDKTALEQATIVGGFSAASAFLPMTFGKTALTSVVGGAGLNVGFGAAQRLATSTVLKANGYDDMAKQYRVFDGEAMAADLVLGAAFGGMGHAFRGHEVSPADVDAAAAVATEDHYNRSAPGVPTDPEVANLHAETMAETLHRMADGDLPDIAPEVAQKLVDNVLPDPIHENAQALHDAALDELPGYEEALAEVDRQELPPEQLAPWRQRAIQFADAVDKVGLVAGMVAPPAWVLHAAGHIAKEFLDPSELGPPTRRALPEPRQAPARDAGSGDILLDDFHQSTLDHLVHNYASTRVLTDDGREVSLRELADEMQKQRNEADMIGSLHEVAAACAARNGF